MIKSFSTMKLISSGLYFSFCELDGLLNPSSKLAQNLHNLQIQEITPGNAQKYVRVKGTSFVSFGSHASLDTLTQIATFTCILSNIMPNKACSKNVGIDKHWTKDCASFYLFSTVKRNFISCKTPVLQFQPN